VFQNASGFIQYFEEHLEREKERIRKECNEVDQIILFKSLEGKPKRKE